MQLDRGEKGFSFMREGPLDMRMDKSSDLTAEEIVNRWPEEELGRIFRELGEERSWRKVARAIIEERKKRRIRTTTELAEIVSGAMGGRGKLHPATLVFQALRICVNHELESLERGLVKSIECLAPCGRVGVISFHRLEDRIVKNVFRDASKTTLHLLTKKPLTASREEMQKNPRARSAKLRFAERYE